MALRYKLTLIALLLFLGFLVPTAQDKQVIADQTIQNDRFGLAFISAADQLADQTRFDGARALGVTWNRWPLYWHWVNDRGYVSAQHDYDTLVVEDVKHRLNSIAILLGTPDMRAQRGTAQVAPPRVNDKSRHFSINTVATTENSFAASPLPGALRPHLCRWQ